MDAGARVKTRLRFDVLERNMRHTKIICTLGPNVDDKATFLKLAEKHMDVARFNFSHGDHAEHKGRLEVLKEIRKETGRPIAALLDTKGPEIRTGLLKDHKNIELRTGGEIVVSINECEGCEQRICVNYAGLAEDAEPGTHILIDDGLIDLEVISKEGDDLKCRIVNGGELGEHKGVNVPGVDVKLPPLTDQDIEDIRFGIREGFDIIAASFVRNTDCIRQIKQLLKDEGAPDILVIAKIENQVGVDNIDEIIKEADGVMVARGDMGVEIEPQKLPGIQKAIIRKCNMADKIVITATQMLDSMIRNPRPTRAEVSDVANAVYDGTDAVMLSGETSIGKYPIEALNMMAKICEDTEVNIDYDSFRHRKTENVHFDRVSNAVAHATISTAMRLAATGVVAPTLSGHTVKLLSKWRPVMPIYAMSPSMSTVRKMMLVWGALPIWSRRAESTDELIDNSIHELLEAGHIKDKDLVVVTAGVLSFRTGDHPSDTNIMRVIRADGTL